MTTSEHSVSDGEFRITYANLKGSKVVNAMKELDTDYLFTEFITNIEDSEGNVVDWEDLDFATMMSVLGLAMSGAAKGKSTRR